MNTMRVSTNILGVFVHKGSKIIKSIRFPDDPQEVAERIKKIRTGLCNEEIDLIGWLAETGNKSVLVERPSRYWGNNLDIEFIEDTSPVDVFSIAADINVKREDVGKLIVSVNQTITCKELKIVERDQLIAQTISALDEIDESINLLVERLREWYSLHFPELDHVVPKHDVYISIVDKVGERKGFSDAKLGLDPDHMKKIAEASKCSRGADFSTEDIEAIRIFTKPLKQLFETKTLLEGYVENLMKELAPNLATLAGELLGARLISKAGSLKRLSIMPASTIQVLGAEDAFFRFLKTRSKPPKHGIIFMHPEIRSAPRSTRGKISRSFAAKLAIAARTDYFKGNYIGDKLLKDFMARVNQLGK